MRNYLLFILLVIICIKIFVVYYEPMTDMVDIIGMGYDESIAKKIIEDQGTICAIPDDSDGTSIGLLTELNAEEKQELLFKDYKLKIKSGEQFHKKLNNLEQQIFISFMVQKKTNGNRYTMNGNKKEITQLIVNYLENVILYKI